MRGNHLSLYLHLVWATWDREPIILPSMERQMHRVIVSKAESMGCNVLAIDGLPEHTHLCTTFPATITVAQLVQKVKGVSSHFINEVFKPTKHFDWQGGYGAFTVSRWDVEMVVNYVKGQKERHAENQLMPEYEEILFDR
ncbi:MAG: IS200/IS605 family transposase [Armatimonadota bacterium]